MKTKSNQPNKVTSSPQGRTPLEILLGVLVVLLVGGGIFYLGYQQGRQSHSVDAKSLTSAASDGVRGGDPARLNPAHPPIPPNATPEMKEFLENQATLADKMAQLRGNKPNAALTPKDFILFHEENAVLLDRQNALSKIIAQQQNTNMVAVPAAQPTPPGATPQLKAYLTAREELMRDEISFMNEHSKDSLADRQAEMQKWRKDNAPRFDQLQKLAQSAGPVVTSTK